jgi:hypothetical protein
MDVCSADPILQTFDETPAPGWFPILKAPQLNYSQKARICF